MDGPRGSHQKRFENWKPVNLIFNFGGNYGGILVVGGNKEGKTRLSEKWGAGRTIGGSEVSSCCGGV